MTKRCFILFFILIALPNFIFAKANPNIPLGKLEKSNLQLVYQDAVIPTYQLYDLNYILVTDLKYLGCYVEHSPLDGSITISAPTYGSSVPETEDIVSSYTATLYGKDVSLDNFQTQALFCNGKTLIPLGALNRVGTLSVVDSICSFSPNPSVPITATETTISNLSASEMKVSLVDIYWTNEAVYIPSIYTLAPYEVIERPTTSLDNDSFYISTVVQSAESESFSYYNSSYMGQVNVELLKKYTYYANRQPLENLGDTIDLEATIAAEDFINSQNLSSPTPNLVWTNIDTQRTYIFEGSTNNWSLSKTFICSTGKDSTPTPKGTFALTRKVPSFGQNKGYCCKYAFGFIGTSYLYHSIIFDKTGTYLLENKGVLGKKASDGCIRFSAENAKWFYDHMTSTTTVFIN